ncbi:MAG: hypothetical protein KJO55_10455, partial [Gammaproteobacteria bacterium]|nr:hypothetical protein [Gammaproteobacteria bacterium]
LYTLHPAGPDKSRHDNAERNTATPAPRSSGISRLRGLQLTPSRNAVPVGTAAASAAARVAVTRRMKLTSRGLRDRH